MNANKTTYNLTRLFRFTALDRVLGGKALHHVAQVWLAAQEELVVVAVEICPRGDAVEAPTRDLSGKGAESTVSAII